MNMKHAIESWKSFYPGLLFVACLLAGTASVTGQTISISPPTGGYPNTTVDLKSTGIDFIVTNTGTTTVTVESITLAPSEFQFYAGWTPFTLTPGQATHYTTKFAPDSAQTFNGTLTFTFDTVNPIVISLTGKGLSTGAIASLSTTAINFGNQAAGTTSTAQTVTVTNSGNTALTVNSATSQPPFSTAGFKVTTLNPGASMSFQVTLFGTTPGSYSNALVIGYDVLPASAVDLSGTVTPAVGFAQTTFPTLPAATLGASYQATLAAVGGTPPYTWSVAAGSALPVGLTLSSSGLISGALPSTAAVKSYLFTVKVADSSPSPKKVLQKMTLPAYKNPGANCNNISWSVAGTTAPLIALPDLGTNTYLGAQGGLYPNGSNVRPVDHDADGVALAQAIQPLDSNGNPDVNGKMAFMSIGESATFNAFTQFQIDANADPAKNQHLVIIPGAQPRAGAAKFADPNNAVWNPIFQYYLPDAGVTANQVVAAWIDVVDGAPTGTFPSDTIALQSELESIAQNLHTKFPNLKLTYFTSNFYAGYSNGISTIYPEPFGYESGFAVKNAIQDQLNGLASLNYDANKGPVMAPWMGWGPYQWTNGLIGRNDSFFWTCTDVTNDGLHPSLNGGREKIANSLLNFLKTDTTTAPWFLSH